MLTRDLRQLNTWVRFSYGVIWTLVVVYLAARLTDTPPWTFAFWETNGTRVALAITGSLLCLGLAYATWEIFLLARLRGSAWRHAFREWRARWFGSGRVRLDEAGRLTAFGAAPLLRALDADQQQQLARAMEPVWHGPWKKLPEYEPTSSPKVALIVSGRLIVHREESTKRKRRVQVLGPGDLLGLHGIADSAGEAYRLRTTSPVALLEADRAVTTELILGRVATSSFGNAVLKVPFLRTISLCRNWHLQAIQRFAQLATLTSYPEGAVICSEGQSVDSFYIVFAGDAVVSREKRTVGVVRVGEFFGEIGLLQNSTANATITARRNTRCLVIARAEFIRFVTHNYAVALELERVSSQRLGRPIFPVRQNHLRSG
jgi:CRP-like cAMP-binding protein